MYSDLEKHLAEYCSPVLLGRKPAALFNMPLAYLHDPYLSLYLPEHVFGIRIYRESNARALTLVYRPDMLTEYLYAPIARTALINIGYPTEDNLDAMLDFLAIRIEKDTSFPHEIGFFLGYPAEDVIGFIQNKGTDYKISGPWKVYGDVGKAKYLFQEYADCRNYLIDYLKHGGALFHTVFLQDIHRPDAARYGAWGRDQTIYQEARHG